MADVYDPEQDKMELDKSIDKQDKKVEEDKKGLSSESLKDLAKQCDAEYRICYDHQYSRKEEALLRLKLYNNQRRDKEAVGDVTMFTTTQTILASLYVDKLAVTFVGREEGDEDTAETLTQMAEFDNGEMEKDVFDFDWIFDTISFGRGLVDMTAFVRDPDKGIFVPAPEVIDPTVFLRDPRAVSINGNNMEGKNSCRFFGSEVRMSKYSMQKNPNFFKDMAWDDVKYGTNVQSLLDRTAQARADAQGNSWLRNRGEEKLGSNSEYDLLRWHTHWMVGGVLKKCRVWLANQRKMVVGFEVLGDAVDRWGVIDRPLYPTSHDWDGTSIWDLTEDKQRMRAVATNLGLKAMMADIYPMYVYDQNKIKNRPDLKFGFNKMIPVDGSPESIAPMRKAAPNMQLLDFIMQTLDRSAQIANATPEIQQGQVSSQKRTLGELNIVASKVDTRYSLSAKVFGWSERRFWQRWYWMYKEYFDKDIDVKTIRITGAFGTKWRGLTKENMKTDIDPDVEVESREMSRAKQLEDRQTLGQYMTLAFTDPTVNKRYGLKKMGKAFGLSSDEMDRLFPPTVDEIQAEEENDLINKNEYVKVFAAQNHNVHLEILSKAKETKAKEAHRQAHIKALYLKMTQPQAFPAPADQAGAGFTPPGSTGATPNAPAPVSPIAPSQAPGLPVPTQ